MTTQTNTSNDAPSTNDAGAEQAAYRDLFVMITVQNAYGHVATSSHDVKVPVGMRHLDLMTHLLKERIPEDLRGNSVVLHYSVHPAVVA
ncbi:hypothetical protein [Nonomuraea sp. NPDC050691]|uniref:hypothetical protein n=1 Tax=Nonomuraea sp. NPDC050691 TaxID=3155661 RepID=UPI0033E5C65C